MFSKTISTTEKMTMVSECRVIRESTVFVCTWCVVVHVANHTLINLNKSLRESNLNHHAEGRVRALLYNTVGNIFGHQTLYTV